MTESGIIETTWRCKYEYWSRVIPYEYDPSKTKNDIFSFPISLAISYDLRALLNDRIWATKSRYGAVPNCGYASSNVEDDSSKQATPDATKDAEAQRELNT